MNKLSQRKEEILQRIADRIDHSKYYYYFVVQDSKGIWLMPEEARFIGDKGEFMGETFEQAKVNIAEFVLELS